MADVVKKMEKKVPARGRALTRQKKKPMLLEVGKTYQSEKGGSVTLKKLDSSGDFYSTKKINGFRGVWSPDGSPWCKFGWTDDNFGALILEAPARKASRKGAAK
jgi:hypothetical protein